MNQKAIIYLHGFNSASLDLAGNLLTSKDKLKVLQAYCAAENILFYSPNVDYRYFQGIVDAMLNQWRIYREQGFDVIFMGSSMGGFSSEYLAMKTGAKAVLINPAISPSTLLPGFIGVTENYETGQAYDWYQPHCDQYRTFESELVNFQQSIHRTVLLDEGDELIDTAKTQLKYKDLAHVVVYQGGSHSFEHMGQALPVLRGVIFDSM